MRELYDIHCHLLPGVDDGAKNIEETMEALQAEYREGVRHIIFTPHYSCERECADADLIAARFAEVRAKLEQTDYGREMTVTLGSELLYSDGILEELNCKKALTLGNSQYLLVEFYPMEAYKKVYEGLRKLENKGYFPILAHIERMECLYRQEARLDELEEMGIYFQVNASSLSGTAWNRRVNFLKDLIRGGRVHFLGTDSHGMEYRKPEIKKAALWVETHCEASVAERLLYENPQAVLEDKTI